MARKFFDHEQFNFEFQFALGGVHYGAGDLGEMLSTADRVIDGDADSWCREWIATGQRLATIAEGCARSGHRVSARSAYLRAATYYAVALSSVDGTKDPAALLQPTFAEHRRCFDAYAQLLDPPAERVEIPYQGETMPGYLFRPSSSDSPRRTLIMNNGSDGPVTSIWPPVSAGGVARGYNVLIFDGPGQQSMLFERGVPFRHDWEHVITPVVDFLLTRPDVDPAQIVLYGISQGGYWVPRALAFEHRIAAAIADPGVYDAFEPSWNAMPPELQQLLDSGDKQSFDRMFDEGMQASAAGAETELGVARKTVRPAVPLRRVHRGPPVQPRRSGRSDHDAVADHRSRRRAVLARPITATIRQTSRDQTSGPVHRRRRRRPPLRTAGQITSRAAHVRLARRNSPSAATSRR